MVDSPTNNFATLNPLDQWQSPAFSEGNLKISSVTGGEYELTSGTVGVNSGKWYFEARLVDTSSGGHQSMGVKLGSAPINSWAGGDAGHWMYYSEGKIVHGGTTTDSTPASYGTAIIGCAIDMDNGEIYWAKDNTWITNASGVCNPVTRANPCYSDLSGSVLPFISVYESSTNWTLNAGQDSSFAGTVTAQGNQDSNGIGDFYYEPPTDYLALCSSNLPSPEIALPTDHFNTIAYSGDGNQAVTGVGFQPDFVWVKSRSDAYDHQAHDVVRGATAGAIWPDLASAEASDYAFDSFDSDGFTTDSGNIVGINDSGSTYAAWNWLAGGTAVSNTDGTITSSVSANTTAGFSIASYTGTGSAATIGHGLSSAPELIIVKNRDADDAWQVGSSKGIDFTDYLVLNDSAAAADNVDRWNDTTPSASVFTIGDGVEVNTNTEDYIAYCFHSVEGYSKVGSYVGNGDADGTFIYTGFKPAFLMVKSYSPNGYDWTMFDDKRNSYNVVNRSLAANWALAEYELALNNQDFLSNGVKMRNTDDGLNKASESYIYLAFAESPFKTSNAW
jgi:hypothetical protein